MEIPSETEIVPNCSGYPPPAWTPSLAPCARRPSDMLQGVISFQELAIPTCGLSQSSSPMPTARSIPLDVVASMPSVTARERGLGSTWLMSPVYRAKFEMHPGVLRGCVVRRDDTRDQLAFSIGIQDGGPLCGSSTV